MKNTLNSYTMMWLGEAMGAKELLSREKRYLNLSQSFKVLATNKTDEEIWDFYQWRKNSYKSIRLFTSFLLTFFIIMAFILTGDGIVVFSVGLPLLIVYGFIAVTVKPERKYAYLWDNKTLFMEFLKFNRTESFNPKNFDQYLEVNKDAEVHLEPNIQDELQILNNETNKFNSVKMESVISFFAVMRENSDFPVELKCVQIADADFIRFIKARFVDNSDDELNIELIQGDKSHIKALFHNFYIYSTTYNGETKKGTAKRYMGLYLYSFQVFEKLDYTNFSDGLPKTLDFTSEIKRFNKMD